MTLVSDLIAARAHFERMSPPKQIQAAHYAACFKSPTSLASLVALREALPAHYADFEAFEGSRFWRIRDAYAVFDRAIALAKSNGAENG